MKSRKGQARYTKTKGNMRKTSKGKRSNIWIFDLGKRARYLEVSTRMKLGQQAFSEMVTKSKCPVLFQGPSPMAILHKTVVISVFLYDLVPVH